MPIRSFVSEQSFDPETIEIMNTAFLAVCRDLGLSDKTDRACEMVAARVIDLTNGHNDPQMIRAPVLASLNCLGRHPATL